MSELVPKEPGTLRQLVGKVPPEAITKAVDIVQVVVSGGLQLATDKQRFEQEMERLHRADASAQEKLQSLMAFAEKMPKESHEKLVDTICELALR